MNKEEILSLDAGEQLNIAVAEQIMGECYHQHWNGQLDCIECLKCGESRFYHQHSQNYSTDISAAWQVVDRMIALGFEITFNYCHTDKWSISFFDERPEMFEGTGKNASEAICKSALIVVLLDKLKEE